MGTLPGDVCQAVIQKLRKHKVLSELEDRVLAESPDDFLAALIPILDVGAITPDELARVKDVVRRHGVETHRDRG